MPTKIKGVRVKPSAVEVYNVLKGQPKGLPDHALVPLTQHVAGVRLSSSGIRTRRRELTDAGLVKPTGEKIVMPSGRTAAVYKVAR